MLVRRLRRSTVPSSALVRSCGNPNAARPEALVFGRRSSGRERRVEAARQPELRPERVRRVLLIVGLAEIGRALGRAEHAADPARPRPRDADDEDPPHVRPSHRRAATGARGTRVVAAPTSRCVRPRSASCRRPAPREAARGRRAAPRPPRRLPGLRCRSAARQVEPGGAEAKPAPPPRRRAIRGRRGGRRRSRGDACASTRSCWLEHARAVEAGRARDGRRAPTSTCSQAAAGAAAREAAARGPSPRSSAGSRRSRRAGRAARRGRRPSRSPPQSTLPRRSVRTQPSRGPAAAAARAPARPRSTLTLAA